MKIFVLIAVLAVSYGKDPDFFWRDYYGTIPGDAILGGTNQDGSKVYIGQGYLRNFGLNPGTIIPGEKEITMHWVNVSQSEYNKILCGNQLEFYWMHANASDLHFQVAGKYAVNGGHDDPNHGYLNIGRVVYGGKVKIGKIASYWIGDARLFYVDKGVEKSANSYEILMYDEGNKVASLFT